MFVQQMWVLFRNSFKDWVDDDAPRLGAALAFYTILSLSPLVIFVVAIVSVFFDRQNAQTHLLKQVQSLAGLEGRNAVQSMLVSGQKLSSGAAASLIGILTLLLGASGVFGRLRFAMDTIWECKPKQDAGLWSMLREKFFSIGMVISVGFTLLVSLLASTGLAAMTTFFRSLVPIPTSLLSLLNFSMSFLGISFIFALILKFVPEAKVGWAEVRVGAVLTAFLFTVGKSLLGLYLGNAAPGSAYGAAGSLVVMVIWVSTLHRLSSSAQSSPTFML